MTFRNTYLLAITLLATLATCESDDGVSNGDNNPQVISVETLGGSNNDSGQSIIATNDGGYAILGFTQSSDGDILSKQDESYDYWILKFDANDTLQWQKTYGGSGDDRGNSIIQTNDGGYAVLGTSNSNDNDVSGNSGMQDFWLAKLDVSGNLVWQTSYGYQGSDTGTSVIQTNDQGFLILGVLDVTASGGEGNTQRNNSRHAGGDYWALKLDASGNIEWSKYFGGNFTDSPQAAVQTIDNEFIIVGGSDSEDTDISGNIGSYDFWVIKISSTGDLIWEKSYGGDQIDEAWAIVKEEDGNFVIAGDTRSSTNDVGNNQGAADIWLIKISPNGDLIWENTIGGTSFDVSRALVKTTDNGFLLAGSSRSSDKDVSENQGQNDAWIVKVNANGNLLWEKNVGGSDIDFLYGIAQLNDDSIIAVGDTSSNNGDILENKGFTDLLKIKMK
ncbi:autotransporter outer membrane beta-barrel domain-containing protein [Winogradskyella ursingii]|uniref:hypothetical protein n=1 Tax=Winogradskyella ursingii TaxID=2686079 RepID=UPI0015CA3C93|nr:hypothetical protein [Winogradskyella ursingii]